MADTKISALTAGAATWDCNVLSGTASILFKVTGATSKIVKWSAHSYGTIVITSAD